MSGDLMEFEPGSDVSARLVADANGDVATRGDAVELVGSGADGEPLVALSSGGQATIGHLNADSPDYDEDATYAADDVVGMCGVLCRHNIDKFVGDGTMAVGDLAMYAAGGGVTAYDPAATGADPLDVIGPVFKTALSGEYDSDKVAVIRWSG